MTITDYRPSSDLRTVSTSVVQDLTNFSTKSCSTVTDYGLSSDQQTVSPSFIQDLTNFSRLKFLGVSNPIDDSAGQTVVRLRSTDATIGCTCRFFFYKHGFWSVLSTGCYNVTTQIGLSYGLMVRP